MLEEVTHVACVDAWMARTAKGLPPELLLKLFEQALGALHRRTQVALGDVTLTAIFDRVLYNAAEKFPLLSAIKVETTGVHCDELRERLGGLNGSELAEGMRFVLVEFLMILGNLTSDILTPALHLELSKVALSDLLGAELTSETQRKGRGNKGTKGAKS